MTTSNLKKKLKTQKPQNNYNYITRCLYTITNWNYVITRLIYNIWQTVQSGWRWRACTSVIWRCCNSNSWRVITRGGSVVRGEGGCYPTLLWEPWYTMHMTWLWLYNSVGSVELKLKDIYYQRAYSSLANYANCTNVLETG